MTRVTLSRYQELSQRNINEFLKNYFDGTNHTIGGIPYSFPDCEKKFGRQQLTRSLGKPWIVVELIPTAKPDKQWAGTSAMKLIRDGEWRFVVVTDNLNKDTAPDWATNDKVSDLLSVILTAKRAELAVGGQKIIRVLPAKKESEDAYMFSIINVTIRCEMSQGT